MTDKYTPGPWAVTDTVGTIYSQARNGQHQICQGPVLGAPVTPPNEERKANAMLIAAAPEMLEALRGVIRVADRATVEFDAARIAIAKAEGC
jgi:hypothetical protein